MASDINPTLTPTKSLTNFRFWCQKVLPLVYDDSLSYYEVLGKMVVQLNDVIDDVNADIENVDTLKEAFLALQTYVNEFFADIDQLASYTERAEAAQTAANQSAINASESATNASASSLAAMNARDAAVTARQAADTSANTASTAASNANTKASEAAQSAITAQTAQASASQSATLAATDRSAAQTAASTATAKANEASESASNAAESASTAEDAAASVEASAEQIAILQNSLSSDSFNILTKDKGAYSENYLGAKFDNFVIDGCVTESQNICITSKSRKEPTIKAFSQLTDDAFSVYLEANKTYTLAMCIFSEYNVPDPAWSNVFTLCDYTTKTTKIYNINDLTVKAKEIYTASITVPTSDYYAIKINFPAASGVKYRICFALYPPKNIYQLIASSTALSLSN